MTDYASILNPEQLAAATAGEGPLLVLAAAGTGKTQTLVYRVAFLVEQGLPPDSILLLTFTNKAAREMLERARRVAGDAVGDVWSGTFHHVCNRLLRRHAPLLGFRHAFIIADRDDTRKLIDDCMKELKLGGKDFPKKDVLNGLFSQAANRCRPLDEILETRLDQLAVDPGDICRIHRRYTARKMELGIMDFDDLLVNGVRLIEEHPAILTRYQQQFRHVLVDEYQDTNLLQTRLVDGLGAGYGNVMAVGDDFQCIYSWRGADFRNIMEFPTRYPAARIIKLERNYRSTPEILAVANASIAGNPRQFQKTLRATRPGGIKPLTLFLRDGREQAEAVVALIRRAHEQGRPLRDMAVLYRAHFHSIELQMELARARVPFVITSGIGVFEQAHIKDVLALLRLAHDPLDRLAFDRLLGLLPGVGPRSVAALWEAVGSHFEGRSADARAQLRARMPTAARADWDLMAEIFAAYFDEHLEEDPGELIYRFVERFYREYALETFENHERRLEDIAALIDFTTRFDNAESFLSEVALLTNLDAEADALPQADATRVRLATIHQAKGLEWKAVVVLWAVEGMFPAARSLAEEDGEAEERRLFYVAATRAQDELYFCVPEIRRMRDGGIMYCEPSRFIRELPSSLYRTEHTSYGG